MLEALGAGITIGLVMGCAGSLSGNGLAGLLFGFALGFIGVLAARFCEWSEGQP